MTGESPAGATVITGPHPDPDLRAVLCQVRDLLKSRDGSSLILDYRVRRAIFLVESSLGGLRHERTTDSPHERTSGRA
jgi:hypothetical protein